MGRLVIAAGGLLMADLRTQDSAVYTAAQNLMAQGLTLWNAVKTNHRCT